MASPSLGALHIDYAGLFLGKMFLVVVDAHSKWLEIEIVPSVTSAHTIAKLRCMFATHGPPQLVVSDNGAVFTSGEFKEFLEKNEIRHVRSSPYHRVVKPHIDHIRSQAVAPPRDNPASVDTEDMLLLSTSAPPKIVDAPSPGGSSSDLTAQVNSYSWTSRLLHSVTGHVPS